MRQLEERLFESTRLLSSDDEGEQEVPFPFALHTINPKGVTPTFESVLGVPLYGGEEFPQALGSLQLGSDEESLWAAAGPVREIPPGSSTPPVTVVRYSAGRWTDVLGPNRGRRAPSAQKTSSSTRSHPSPARAALGSALDRQLDLEGSRASAVVAHVAADGSVEAQTLPSAQEAAEGVGPKGAAQRITCPSFDDCWMTTTRGGCSISRPKANGSCPKRASIAPKPSRS